LQKMIKKKRLSPRKKAKQEEKRKKAIRTTLDWMDFYSMSNEGIVLKRGHTVRYVKGISLTPYNINLLSNSEKVIAIQSLANSLDRIRFPLYWKFVKTSPDVGAQQGRYSSMMRKETNASVLKLLEMELSKLDWFKRSFPELSFFVLVQEDKNHIDKCYEQMTREIGNVFRVRPMRNMDYINLVKQEFENDTVDEYMITQVLLPSERPGLAKEIDKEEDEDE